MDDQITIGARLRVLRRWRGMTQTELAGLTGVTQAWLSMVERGLYPLDRRSHVAALAAALRVSETDLTGGPHLSEDPVQTGPHNAVRAVRAALTSAELGESPVDRARPVEELVALITGPIEEADRVNNWSTVLTMLPDVLEELHFHVAAAVDERTLKTALSALLDAAMEAAGILGLLGYADLRYIAVARAAEAAAMLDDPVARGKAMYMLARPTDGDWQRAARRAEAETARLEPHADSSEALQVLGMLCLNASLVSAAGLDADAARSWLDRATDVARHVPDHLSNWQSFSATNVNVWRVKVNVELGEAGGKVLELADRVDQEKVATYPARQVNFLGEVGRGVARDRQMTGEAMRWLADAERVGPQRVRNHAPIRETVAVMLEQARVAAVGRELRGMAARMGIPH